MSRREEQPIFRSIYRSLDFYTTAFLLDDNGKLIELYNVVVGRETLYLTIGGYILAIGVLI